MVNKHSDRLKRMTQQTAKELAKALYKGDQLIELDAERSITAGTISGKNHVPSLPGQPPNADTRFLDGNIETEIGGPTLVTITSKAPYSAALEYGTSKMAARPFMRPATEKHRKDVIRLVGDAVSLTVK